MPHTGERRRYLALAAPVGELAVLLAAILVVDQQFFGGTRFWDADLDPFLLPILILSVQYGAAFGVFAALSSAVALLTGPLPPLTFSHDLYSHIVLIAQRPVLWLIIAVALGALSGQHIRRARRIGEVLIETDQQRGVIVSAYAEAQRANDALVLRLNSERVSFSHVSDAIQRLLGRSPDEMVSGVDDLVTLTLGAHKFSIFIMRANRLDLARSKGWRTDAEFAHVYAKDSPLFRAVAEQRRLLCVANPLDEVSLGRDGVLAGPICDPNSGEALGMLKIEELDFMRLGAETINNFRVAVEWLGFAMSGGASRPRLPSLSLRKPLANALGELEYAEAALPPSPTAVHKSLLSVVFVTMPRIRDVEHVGIIRDAMRHAVSTALTADRLVEMDDTGVSFLLVFPGLPAESAKAHVKKLEVALRQCLPSALKNMQIDTREKTLCLASDALSDASLLAQQAA